MFWGSGVLKGLAVTFKNFVASYPAGAWALRRLGRSVDGRELFTVPYPEERLVQPERFRYYPFLVYDDDKDPDHELRCVACKICEKECPPQCIYIDKAQDDQGRPLKQPAKFDIDVSICMSCQICVEVCPFDAIKMDAAFEESAYDRLDSLLFDKRQLSKPNSYYNRIKPTEAAAVDAALRAKAEKAEAAKRASEAKKAAQESPPPPPSEASAA